jgi:hypothetical protein
MICPASWWREANMRLNIRRWRYRAVAGWKSFAGEIKRDLETLSFPRSRVKGVNPTGRYSQCRHPETKPSSAVRISESPPLGCRRTPTLGVFIELHRISVFRTLQTIQNVIIIQLTCVLWRIWGVTIDGVWTGEWIYWPLVYTTRNYTLQITDTHRLVFSVYYSLQ